MLFHAKSHSNIALGIQTQVHNAIVIHASQCFSDDRVIMKNIRTFSYIAAAAAEQISFPRQSREGTH